MTNEEMILEIDNAINKVLITGQSYKLGSRQVTRANISELKTLRDQLTIESGQKSSDYIGGTYVAFFEGR